MTTTVNLVSWTANPIETLLHLWEASRSEGVCFPLQHWTTVLATPTHPQHADAWQTFHGILDAGIPVAENVSLTFMLDNVSIELREQMVRHRIGHHFGDRLGADLVPDLADSTWWSQSMRVLNMGKFATNRRYRVPVGVDADKYHAFMLSAEAFYNEMVEDGVPREDARAVLPLACTHRISWTTNLAAVRHVLHKRGCWILQLGLWQPVITGMVEQMATKIDPVFRRLISPPCVKGDKFTGCHFELDNVKRLKDEDPLPPCQLFLSQHKDVALYNERPDQTAWYSVLKCCEDGISWQHKNRTKQKQLRQMATTYEELWNRDINTGATR